MKYLMGVFGVILAFVFATAIADNPLQATRPADKRVADWNDVGSRILSLQANVKPIPIRRAEYR